MSFEVSNAYKLLFSRTAGFMGDFSLASHTPVHHLHMRNFFNTPDLHAKDPNSQAHHDNLAR